MRQLRLLRILLPLVLVLFVVVIALSLRGRPAVHRQPPATNHTATRRAEGVESVHIEGDKPSLDLRARVVEQLPGGAIHVEQIERIGIARDDGAPLEVAASSADISGDQGERRMKIRDDVVVLDPDADLRLELPALDVDETSGEARSRGAIRLEGRRARGRAAGLVYGLEGQPSELEGPAFEDATGLSVRADRAYLYDGLRDVEFQGDVEGRRPQQTFSAAALRVWRDDEGRLLRSRGTGGMSMRLEPDAEAPMDVAADEVETSWDPPGEVRSLALSGGASVTRDADALSADRIVVRAEGDPAAPWSVQAEGTVLLQGRFGDEDGWLRTRKLDATFDRDFGLRGGAAHGQVRFEAPSTRAEADEATLEPDGASMWIHLLGTDRSKARLARERTRVAAVRIATDARGGTLHAEDRVEATLLPGGAAGASGLFRTEEAIHFVAERLDGRDSGRRLAFAGSVRGWQGERNLSADEVEVDQGRRTLDARGSVATRIPRDASAAAAGEAHYVQIGAAELAYDEASHQARYTGGVRVDLVEGWLEAERLEVSLNAAGAIHEIEAAGDVRVEFRDETETPVRLVAGTADRLTWDPAASTMRLFGERRPASVRRLGPGGATTSGRVLRYRLDVATLEVESGEQGPARIRGGASEPDSGAPDTSPPGRPRK